MFDVHILSALSLAHYLHSVENSLPPLCRRVVILIKYENHTYIDAARMLNISPAKVQKLYERAIEHCTMKLAEYKANH